MVTYGILFISYVTILQYITLEQLSHVKKCVTSDLKFVTFDFRGIHINQHISRLASLMNLPLDHTTIFIFSAKNTHR